MLKLTKELAQKCLDNHLKINRIDASEINANTLQLSEFVNQSTDESVALDQLPYLCHPDVPRTTLYEVEAVNGETLTEALTPDATIHFIQDYCRARND